MGPNPNDSDRRAAALAGADAHALLERHHEDLAVSDLAAGRARALDDGPDRRLHIRVVDPDRHLSLVHEVVPHRLAAEVLHLTALTPMPVHGLDGEAIVVALVERQLECSLYRVECFGADDGDDQ